MEFNIFKFIFITQAINLKGKHNNIKKQNKLRKIKRTMVLFNSINILNIFINIKNLIYWIEITILIKVIK